MYQGRPNPHLLDDCALPVITITELVVDGHRLPSQAMRTSPGVDGMSRMAPFVMGSRRSDLASGDVLG